MPNNPGSEEEELAARLRSRTQQSRAQKGAGESTPAPVRRSTRTATVSTAGNEAQTSFVYADANGAKTPQRSLLGRIFRGLLLAILGLFILGVLAVVALYIRTSVPAVDEFATSQTTRVYYDDGQTEIGVLSEVNREIIDPTTLPDYVSKAVVASEDRTFYTNSGIDLKGIARAFWTNVTTGTRQGGSTLTQQYVERYYMGTTTSYMGKAKEAILALKINNEQTKEEILGNYLNTIYFGRGAYGIEAASKAFFGHPASEMTLSEAAMLAGIIPAPSKWDPAKNQDQAFNRWARVLQLMVEDKWITKAEAESLTFPEVIPPRESALRSFSGTEGYLLKAVTNELVETGAFTEEEIETGGYKIVTSINKERMEAATLAGESMNEVRGWKPGFMQVALTSVNPTNGEITAIFGGSDYLERQQNAATQDLAMGGSTFKPFALLANARQGGSINDVYDGSSPQYFPGMSKPVRNSGNANYGDITLLRATQVSANTPFVNLNMKIGPELTKQAAIDAGLPADTPGLDAAATNVLGSASPTNKDMAQAYSTIANGGMRVKVHFVREVFNHLDEKIYTANTVATEAFTKEQVSSIMPALFAVTQGGGTFSRAPQAGLNVQVAGKSGTASDNKSAVAIGFTPELVTVVSMYQMDENGNPVSLDPLGGREVYGGNWPGTVWVTYMRQIRDQLTVKEFPWYVAPKVQRPATPVRPTPEPEPEPAPEPEQQETPEPEPTPAPEPEPTPAPAPEPESTQSGPAPSASANG